METLHLITEAECVGLGPVMAPKGSTPWRNLIWRKPDGRKGVALAGQETYPVLDSLQALVGKVIKLRPGPNGLKLPSLEFQPPEVVEAVNAVVVEPEEATEEVASAPEPISDSQMDKVMTLASKVAEQAKQTGVVGIFACFIPPDR